MCACGKSSSYNYLTRTWVRQWRVVPFSGVIWGVKIIFPQSQWPECSRTWRHGSVLTDVSSWLFPQSQPFRGRKVPSSDCRSQLQDCFKHQRHHQSNKEVPRAGLEGHGHLGAEALAYWRSASWCTHPSILSPDRCLDAGRHPGVSKQAPMQPHALPHTRWLIFTWP